jgi:hypothetical protein
MAANASLEIVLTCFAWNEAGSAISRQNGDIAEECTVHLAIKKYLVFA